MLYINRGRRHSLSLEKTKHSSSSCGQHPALSNMQSSGPPVEMGGTKARKEVAHGLLQHDKHLDFSRRWGTGSLVGCLGCRHCLCCREPVFILLLFFLTSSPGKSISLHFPPKDGESEKPALLTIPDRRQLIQMQS